MRHDRNPAAAVYLTDHFKGIRLFPQDLVGGRVFDHEFGGAPVLLISLARDQLKDHFFLHLVFADGIAAVVQNLFPGHLHTVRGQAADKLPVAADFGFNYRLLKGVKPGVCPVAAQAHNMAVLGGRLTGDFDSSQKAQAF